MAPTRNTELVVFVIVAFVVVYAFGGNLPFIGSAGGGPSGDDDGKIEVEVTQPDKACGSTTMTVDFSQKYSQSTDVTAQNATIYIDGKEKGTYSEGGTFTAQGGNNLNAYYALNDLGNTYYAAHASGKIPCTGQTAAFLTSEILGPGSLAGSLQNPPDEVYKGSTAITATPYDKKTLTALATTSLAIGQGGTQTARIYLDYTYEEGYGVADGNTLACQMTDNDIEQSEVVASLDGTTLGPAKYIPATTQFALHNQSQATRYWHMPGVDGKLTTTQTLDIMFKADSNRNPDSRTNVSCTIFDTDLFKTDVGTVAVGIEDSDDNTNVGRSTETTFHIPMS